ncbi:MAG: flagellar hook-basal body complex protein FliE [Fimbriimonadaceae bacterium]|nr:flagellar hook-basal body complex protein FliE [Fimbriimonadaceae bacterium]
MLMDALKEVNKAQQDAKGLQNDLMANRPVEFHDLMIAMERASTAMALTLQVRNKVLEAYQEVSRMQV